MCGVGVRRLTRWCVDEHTYQSKALTNPTAIHTRTNTTAFFDRYCATVEDTAEWGGELEVRALVRQVYISVCLEAGNMMDQ